MHFFKVRFLSVFVVSVKYDQESIDLKHFLLVSATFQLVPLHIQMRISLFESFFIPLFCDSHRGPLSWNYLPVTNKNKTSKKNI